MSTTSSVPEHALMGGYSTDFHLVTAGDFGDDIEAMIRNAGQPALAPLGAAAGALPTAAWSAREAQPLSDDLFSYFLDESSQDSQKSESTFHVAPSASSVGTTAPAWSGVITFPETMRTTPLPHGALEPARKPCPSFRTVHKLAGPLRTEMHRAQTVHVLCI